MKKKNILIFLLLSLGAAAAQASKFKGYSRVPSSEIMVLKEVVERFVETKTDFLILLQHHPAFYRFPKKTLSTEEIADFLQSRIKSQKPVQVEIDPVTAEIYYLGDPQK